MITLDQKTWKKLTREYDETLEQAGMITGRKAVALFNAMPPEQQRKLLAAMFLKPKQNRSLKHEEREDQSGDTAP